VKVARQADVEQGASLTMLATWGNALANIGDFASAGAALDEALIKARVAGSPVRLFNTITQAVMATTEAGDVAHATQLLGEAERSYRPGSPPLLEAYLEICGSRVALATGNAQRAVDRSKRALELLVAASPTQQTILPTQTFLARSLNASGRFAEAVEYAERSLTQSRKRLGAFHHSSAVGSALLEQATAYRGLRRLDEARTAVSEALEHVNDTLGPQSPTAMRAQRLQATLATDSH
jgi:tetratricopeptide (TPR) repeat protein